MEKIINNRNQINRNYAGFSKGLFIVIMVIVFFIPSERAYAKFDSRGSVMLGIGVVQITFIGYLIFKSLENKNTKKVIILPVSYDLFSNNENSLKIAFPNNFK